MAMETIILSGVEKAEPAAKGIQFLKAKKGIPKLKRKTP